MINEYTIKEIAINSNFLDSISEYFFGGSGESSTSTNVPASTNVPVSTDVPVKTDAFVEKFDELKATLRNHREVAKKEKKLQGWVRYRDHTIITLYLRVFNDPIKDNLYGILNTIVPEDLFVNIERALTQEERDKLEQLLKVVMKFGVGSENDPIEKFLEKLKASVKDYESKANYELSWNANDKKAKKIAKKYRKLAEEIGSWIEIIEDNHATLLEVLEKVNEISKRR